MHSDLPERYRSQKVPHPAAVNATLCITATIQILKSGIQVVSDSSGGDDIREKNVGITLPRNHMINSSQPVARAKMVCSQTRCVCILIFQPQNEYIELHQKRYGKRLDHEERK